MDENSKKGTHCSRDERKIPYSQTRCQKKNKKVHFRMKIDNGASTSLSNSNGFGQINLTCIEGPPNNYANHSVTF